MTPREVLLVEAKKGGLVGVDREELVFLAATAGADPDGVSGAYAWGSELSAAEAEGAVESVVDNCVRLPLSWWSAQLTREWGMNHEQADAIVALLAGGDT